MGELDCENGVLGQVRHKVEKQIMAWFESSKTLSYGSEPKRTSQNLIDQLIMI